ncbi:MAG TPA: glycosyltransferase family 4 protein [Patescibacteria group bacterium]|nr:glycosyltransferase family 4 protein [Patescibacteria group bacterium]
MDVKKLRIGIIGSLWISIPPKGFGYGSQQYIVYHLAQLLKKKGHDVTLFASKDSHVSTKLVSIIDKQVMDIKSSDTRINEMFELLNLSEGYRRHKDFDIIHNHLLPFGLLFPQITKTPTVHTLHHAIYSKEIKADYYLYQQNKEQNFISISNQQRKIVPQLNYVSTVYNGVDPDFYMFKEKPENNYWLYIGRLKRYKGIHTTISLAKKFGINLKIATNLPHASQNDYLDVKDYWEKEIKPQLGSGIEYIGLVDGKEKIALLQNAKALLFPVEREEPFGMTLIEAMSCGLPVIAYARGAVPEIIKDGETGLLVNPSDDDIRGDWIIKKTGIEGLSEAVDRIYAASDEQYLKMRYNCRKLVQEKFTVEKMVDEYERVYKLILGAV